MTRVLAAGTGLLALIGSASLVPSCRGPVGVAYGLPMACLWAPRQIFVPEVACLFLSYSLIYCIFTALSGMSKRRREGLEK